MRRIAASHLVFLAGPRSLAADDLFASESAGQ
jgi:hypothetical protein